ncbi:MAG: hypothetical protein ACJ8F7_13405 [Gemmataceae bacterium]
MESQGRALFRIGLVFLIVGTSGCMTMTRDRPFTVLVRDAETKKPIANAEVKISYPPSIATRSAAEKVGNTKADGIARLDVTPAGDLGVIVAASVKGYVSESLNVPESAIEAINPPKLLFETAALRTPNFTLDLYAAPEFAVEFVVPAGYRGVIRAKVRIDPAIHPAAGQRCFQYPVPKSGLVDVTGPTVLRRLLPLNYHAHYADGTPLGNDLDPVLVAFHWLKRDGEQQIFVVGTKSEYEGYAKSFGAEGKYTEIKSDGSKDSGKGGGRHRGGIGGGSPGGS